MRYHFTKAEGERNKLAFQRLITAIESMQGTQYQVDTLGRAIRSLALAHGYGLRDGRVL